MKGDESILRVTDEVSNLLMNSNMRYAQHFQSIVGTDSYQANFTHYSTFDRFFMGRNGVGDAGDGISRVAPSPGLDSIFENVIKADRPIVAGTEDGIVGQKIESIFAKRLAREGRMSVRIPILLLNDTDKITIKFRYANVKDNWSADTVFHTQVFNAGVEIPFGEWTDDILIENVPVPFQGENGIMVQMNFTNDGSASQVCRIETTGWQCNEGRKVLDWRLMRGDDIQEINVLRRYFEKSYRPDNNPGTLGGNDQRYTTQATQSVSNDRLYLGQNGAFLVEKRVSASVRIFNHRGNALENFLSIYNGDTNAAVTDNWTGGKMGIIGYAVNISGTFGTSTYGWHFLAIAEL